MANSQASRLQTPSITMSTKLITIRASSAPVKSVTIFQSWTAEVTRTLALELKVSSFTSADLAPFQ